jgi:RimJ/RimL family protein N-acetyltransferase
MLRQQYGPVPIVLDPLPENRRAIRCYEKAGFVFVELRPGYKPGIQAYFMRLSPVTRSPAC